MSSWGDASDGELAYQYLNVIIFKEFCSDQDNKEEVLQLSQASEEVKNSIEAMPEVLVFERDETVWVFIVKGESEDEVRNRTEEIKDTLLKVMEKYVNLSFFGGIGSTIQRLTDLSKSYSQANKAFSSRFFVPHNKIVTAAEVGYLDSPNYIEKISTGIIYRICWYQWKRLTFHTWRFNPLS